MLGRVLGPQRRFDDLADRVFVLAGAVRDVERLMARGGDADPDDQRVALVWLLEAARPLVDAVAGAEHAPPVP